MELIPDQWTVLKTELYTAGFSQGTWRMMFEKKNLILMYLISSIFKQVLEKFLNQEMSNIVRQFYQDSGISVYVIC